MSLNFASEVHGRMRLPSVDSGVPLLGTQHKEVESIKVEVDDQIKTIQEEHERQMVAQELVYSALTKVIESRYQELLLERDQKIEELESKLAKFISVAKDLDDHFCREEKISADAALAQRSSCRKSSPEIVDNSQIKFDLPQIKLVSSIESNESMKGPHCITLDEVGIFDSLVKSIASEDFNREVKNSCKVYSDERELNLAPEREDPIRAKLTSIEKQRSFDTLSSSSSRTSQISLPKLMKENISPEHNQNDIESNETSITEDAFNSKSETLQNIPLGQAISILDECPKYSIPNVDEAISNKLPSSNEIQDQCKVCHEKEKAIQILKKGIDNYEEVWRMTQDECAQLENERNIWKYEGNAAIHEICVKFMSMSDELSSIAFSKHKHPSAFQKLFRRKKKKGLSGEKVESIFSTIQEHKRVLLECKAQYENVAYDLLHGGDVLIL